MPKNSHYIKNCIDWLSRFYPRLLLIIALCIAFLLRFNGYKIEYIASSSMEPILMTGQLVLAKEVDASDCSIGDIITYKASGYTITHRIINETCDSFEFKGDNNDFSDGYIHKSKVLYKIVAY